MEPFAEECHPRKLFGKSVSSVRDLRLHVAVTVRGTAGFSSILGRHCGADLIPRCEAIQPGATFLYADVLHRALRISRTIFRELSPSGRFSFGLSRLSFLLGLRLPGRVRSPIVPPSLLLFLSLREACP